MSTRSTTHFIYMEQNQASAIVYRHPDGYPEGHGTDLYRFLRECAKLEDPRFSDPSYLAAKLVVWLADRFRYSYRSKDGVFDYVKNESLLDFLSVGVVMSDPGDIDYRYIIRCGTKDEEGLPLVECIRVGGYPELQDRERCEIPRPEPEE
jgi:hypothetical protein